MSCGEPTPPPPTRSTTDRSPCSSRWITAPPRRSASTPPAAPTALRPSNPVRQGVRRHFGGPAPDAARGLQPPTRPRLPIHEPAFSAGNRLSRYPASPSFVREPQGNGIAERFIRTLKEQLLWIRDFDTVEELNQALQEWRILYNERWLAQRHRHRSPAQVRRELMPARTQRDYHQLSVREIGGGGGGTTLQRERADSFEPD